MRQNTTTSTSREFPPSLAPATPEPQTAASPSAASPAQAFYSFADLAERWRCSQTQVRRILSANGVRVMDMAAEGRTGKKIVPAKTLRQLETKLTRKIG